MTAFCAKCGAELSPSAQFCAACGSPANAGNAQAIPGFTPVSLPTQPATGTSAGPAYIPVAVPVQTAAAQAGSGSSAVKIILIVVAIFVALGVLGAGAVGFMVWRVSRAIHVNGSNGQVTLHTPGGSYTTDSSASFTADDLGTAIYPGAQASQGGMRMDMPTGSMVTGVFLTSDPKDAVVNFYKGKLGSDVAAFNSGNGALLSVKRSDGESIMVTISARNSENSGKTKIVIVHTKSKKAA